MDHEGLGESIRAGGDGLLIRDAGLVSVHDSYDADELVSEEILIDRGGHPILASGFDQGFCGAVAQGLGLS